MTADDRIILRELAKKQLSIAQSEKMQNLKNLWLKHNLCKDNTPMITVELSSFSQAIIPALMKCQDEDARGLEATLLSNIVNTELFGDDTVVSDYIGVRYSFGFTPFGLRLEQTCAQNSIGYHYDPIITDLEQDFHKLKKSTFHCDKISYTKQLNWINEIIGDILPAKLVGQSLYCCPTQNIVKIMGMENMFVSMYDYPELFMEMMNRLSDDYIEYLRFLEKEDVFLPTAHQEYVRQGTYCFTNELPDKIESHALSTNLWGFMDSQETVGVSSEMFSEFIFPTYQKIAKEYGLLSYGCCEPVDPIWDSCLSKLENLRRVSISPWCNEEYMGERLVGKNVVYHRKPSPNFLGVGSKLDEDGLRKHIQKTLKAAKGCSLEFTQRDVYELNSSYKKVQRYVDIIREECIKNW